MRAADYVASFLFNHNITDVFSVVGGGSMFLNDAFAHFDGIKVLYNHHEQASTMAAESYYKTKGSLACVCVTSGPGGTNTITGVLGAYQDSIPLFMISGQVRYETTVESTGLPLRQFGSQEHQIVDTVKNITKYAVMVKDAKDLRFCLEKAYYEATHGRRGPVWVDIPLNVQNSDIVPDELEGFSPQTLEEDCSNEAKVIIDEINKCARPLLVVGSAVRTIGYTDAFVKLVHRLGVPVVYPLNVPDAILCNDSLAMGCFGGVANRAANIAVQNSDLLIVFGCRLAFNQIGFNYAGFSPNSRKITIDIDPAEQEKPTLKRDIKIIRDVGEIIDELIRITMDESPIIDEKWIRYCTFLKRRFPIYRQQYDMSIEHRVNPYFIAKRIVEKMGESQVLCLGNSSGLDPILQMGINKKGQRIILNCNCGSMGYCLPAGIGAYVATQKPTIVYTGDGCIQMNIQELETIVYNNMDIKIIVLNNGGYGGIVATHNNFFAGRISGANADSGLGMPDMEKISNAYGLKYFKMATHDDIDVLDSMIAHKGPCIMEVMQDSSQRIEPCVTRRVDEKGKIVSTGIDDMEPLLPLEEYEMCQFDNWVSRIVDL